MNIYRIYKSKCIRPQEEAKLEYHRSTIAIKKGNIPIIISKKWGMPCEHEYRCAKDSCIYRG